jgi:hypothetical protein
MLKGFYHDVSKHVFSHFGDRNLRAILQIYPKYSQKFCGEIGIKMFSMKSDNMPTNNAVKDTTIYNPPVSLNATGSP